MRFADIQRLDLGYFTMPDRPGDPLSGQPIVVCAYLIRHPRGLFLFDTGLARADDETEAHYHPVPWPIEGQLKRLGIETAEIAAVANCHLHFDHSGGNRHFPHRPIFAQRTEYAAAREPDYTMPIVVEFAGAAYEILDGEAEIWPGLRIIPTPGHTDGHQTLIVETDEGRVALAASRSTPPRSSHRRRSPGSFTAPGGRNPAGTRPGWSTSRRTTRFASCSRTTWPSGSGARHHRRGCRRRGDRCDGPNGTRQTVNR